MSRPLRAFAALLAGLALHAVASAQEAAPQKSLYERLGGEVVLVRVVDEFVARATADPAVHFTREGTEKLWEATAENVEKLKLRLVDFLAFASGGPRLYGGRDMKSAHAGMRITEPEFAAFEADLAASLERSGVPAAEQKELLEIVGRTRADIVEAQEDPRARQSGA